MRSRDRHSVRHRKTNPERLLIVMICFRWIVYLGNHTSIWFVQHMTCWLDLVYKAFSDTVFINRFETVPFVGTGFRELVRFWILLWNNNLFYAALPACLILFYIIRGICRKVKNRPKVSRPVRAKPVKVKTIPRQTFLILHAVCGDRDEAWRLDEDVVKRFCGFSFKQSHGRVLYCHGANVGWEVKQQDSFPEISDFGLDEQGNRIDHPVYVYLQEITV